VHQFCDVILKEQIVTVTDGCLLSVENSIWGSYNKGELLCVAQLGYLSTKMVITQLV